MQLQIETPRVYLPLLGKTRFKGAKGGRGGGKSHFVGEMLIEEAILGHVRCVCAREIQNSIKDSVKQLLEDKIAKLNVQHLFKITDDKIEGPNNSLFVFKGLQNHTTASIKSLEGFNRLWIEEAQTVSQRSLDLAIPTFRTPGAQIICTWNPENETDPVDKFFLENQDDPDFTLITVNYYDNPWFPEELRRDMERDKKRDYEKYLHIWEGEYKRNSEARVFKNWKQQEFISPANATYYLGADWGFSIDPSVLIRCRIDGRILYIDYEAYMVGCEIDALPMLFDRVPDSRKWFITADSARPETISYMRKNGYPRINPAIKGARSVEEGIEFLQSFDIVVHPRCENTLRELTMYSYKIDKLTQQILPILEDKDNHLIDALRYALESYRKNKRPSNNIPTARPFRPSDAGAGY